MRTRAAHMLWLLAVAGLMLGGCGDSKSEGEPGDTAANGGGAPPPPPPPTGGSDSGDAGDGGAKSGGAKSGGGSPIELPELAPEVAAKWKEHTLDLPFVVGYEEGMKLAEDNGLPAMMYVTTTWWGYCKKLSGDSFNNAEIRELLSQFVCVIVDGDTEREAMQKLGAGKGFPHIVFVSSEGENIGECLGYRPAADFKGIVEQALGQAGS